MKQTFQRYPDLKNYLDKLSFVITSTIETYSVLSYGCLALDDFSKRYSTIELVAILKKGLWHQDYDKISEIVDQMYASNETYASRTQVYFVPLEMIENPRVNFDNLEGVKVHGREEKIISSYPLNPIDDFLIREKGEILTGEDMRNLFPLPPSDVFWNQFITDIVMIEKWTKEYPFQMATSPNYEKAVNRLLYFPRLLYSIKENNVIGKTKVIYWFSSEFHNEISDFITEVGVNRKKDLSLINILNIEEKSMKMLNFCINEILLSRRIDNKGLSDKIRKNEDIYDYSRYFMELRNLLN